MSGPHVSSYLLLEPEGEYEAMCRLLNTWEEIERAARKHGNRVLLEACAVEIRKLRGRLGAIADREAEQDEKAEQGFRVWQGER